MFMFPSERLKFNKKIKKPRVKRFRKRINKLEVVSEDISEDQESDESD
jgi:hypothetical protein